MINRENPALVYKNSCDPQIIRSKKGKSHHEGTTSLEQLVEDSGSVATFRFGCLFKCSIFHLLVPAKYSNTPTLGWETTPKKLVSDKKTSSKCVRECSEQCSTRNCKLLSSPISPKAVFNSQMLNRTASWCFKSKTILKIYN